MTVSKTVHGGSNPSSSANKTDKHFLLVRFVFRYLIRGIRTPNHGDDRKRREKQALAFAEIERSGHSQQPDTQCQMQGISAKARLLSEDAPLCE